MIPHIKFTAPELNAELDNSMQNMQLLTNEISKSFTENFNELLMAVAKQALGREFTIEDAPLFERKRQVGVFDKEEFWYAGIKLGTITMDYSMGKITFTPEKHLSK